MSALTRFLEKIGVRREDVPDGDAAAMEAAIGNEPERADTLASIMLKSVSMSTADLAEFAKAMGAPPPKGKGGKDEDEGPEHEAGESEEEEQAEHEPGGEEEGEVEPGEGDGEAPAEDGGDGGEDDEAQIDKDLKDLLEETEEDKELEPDEGDEEDEARKSFTAEMDALGVQTLDPAEFMQEVLTRTAAVVENRCKASEIRMVKSFEGMMGEMMKSMERLGRTPDPNQPSPAASMGAGRVAGKPSAPGIPGEIPDMPPHVEVMKKSLAAIGGGFLTTGEALEVQKASENRDTNPDAMLTWGGAAGEKYRSAVTRMAERVGA